MKGAHDEIQAIQARLQAINARETGYRPATSSSMIEIFPATRPGTPPHPGSQGNVAVVPEPLTREQATLQWPIATSAVPATEPQTLPVTDRPTSPNTERAVLNQLDTTWKQLTAQADHINQLASAQENALLELRAIAQRLERDWRATGLESFPYPESNGDLSPLYQASSAEVPWVERNEDGSYILSRRSLDLLKSEREALRIAQELRKRRPQAEASFLTPAGEAVAKWLKGLFTSRPSAANRGGRRVAASAIATAPDATMPLPIAAVWLVGSTLARVAIDLVLVSNPTLWLPAVALIVAPAAIAAYRTTVAPETSIQWGYRLLLIMVGLLLGGRF